MIPRSLMRASDAREVTRGSSHPRFEARVKTGLGSGSSSSGLSTECSTQRGFEGLSNRVTWSKAPLEGNNSRGVNIPVGHGPKG